MVPKPTFLRSFFFFFTLMGVVFIDFCGVLWLICFKRNKNRRSGRWLSRQSTYCASMKPEFRYPALRRSFVHL